MTKVFAAGTRRAAKLECIRQAGQIVFPNHEIVVSPQTVQSNISDMPMSLEEMFTGARNRARQALDLSESADLGVGVESGLSQFAGRWFDSGLIVVVDRDGNEGIGESVKLEIGQRVMGLIDQGMELSAAVMEVTAQDTVASRDCFHALTDGALRLTDTYRDATIAALSRFAQEHLFK